MVGGTATEAPSKLLRAYDRSRVQLYVQVASVIRQRIESGVWAPGQRIPTHAQLEKEFQVAQVTVRQAVEIMRQEGLLECYQGRGTFIAAKPPNKRWLELATDWSSLVASLKDNVAKMILPVAEVDAPSIDESEGKPAASYVLLRSVQFHEGSPYGIINAYVSTDIHRRNPKEFGRHPALPVLAGVPNLKIKRAVQTMVLGSADPETADLLQVAIGAPTAECRCVVTDAKGVVIYVAKIVYRSDCLRLEVDFLGAKSKAPAKEKPGSAARAAPKQACTASQGRRRRDAGSGSTTARGVRGQS